MMVWKAARPQVASLFLGLFRGLQGLPQPLCSVGSTRFLVVGNKLAYSLPISFPLCCDSPLEPRTSPAWKHFPRSCPASPGTDS